MWIRCKVNNSKKKCESRVKVNSPKKNVNRGWKVNNPKKKMNHIRRVNIKGSTIPTTTLFKISCISSIRQLHPLATRINLKKLSFLKKIKMFWTLKK